MGFHRLTAPSYFGGLPGGYNYINNLLGPGSAALVDGPRASGPDLGTYFVGFGENARSNAVNRGLAALAENTDILDGYLHLDLAIPAVTADVTAGAPVTAIVLTGPIFIGMAGTPNTVAGIRKFITLVDNEDNEIYNVTECQVTAISPDVPGNEWSVGNVTLTISPAIPTGVTYRVYYNTRGNVATFTDDALIKNRRPYNRYNGGVTWADGQPNPATSVTNQLDKILTDLSGTNGTFKIGGLAYDPGGHYSLPTAQLVSQLQALLDLINFQYEVRLIFSADTLTINDGTVIIQAVSSFNIAMPDPALAKGQRINLVARDHDIVTYPVTLTPFASETFNFVQTSYTLNIAHGRWILVSDGLNWFVSESGIFPSLSRQALVGPVTTAIAASTDLVTVDTTGGAVTAILPSPFANSGRVIRFRDIGGMLATNNLTIARFGSTRIENIALDYVVNAPGAKLSLWADGSGPGNWWFV